MVIKDINYYRLKFSPRTKLNKIGLNVSRSAGVAPNKPVLLLAIIELIQRGEIQRNEVYLSPELIAAFLKFWSHLGIERRADIGLPFFHLKSDGFWHFRANPIDSSQYLAKMTSVGALKQAVQYAYLDSELFKILQQPSLRAELTLVLTEQWFFDKAQQIERLLQFNAFEDLQKRLLSTGGKVYQREEVEKEDEQTAVVRNGAFRRNVISAYGYRCAFCRLQVFNALKNIVDGAHIKPFSQFYDDRINNGLSLCKNHHWAFDRFWFTIKPDYTILISDSLWEDSPYTTPMKNFQGHRILVPDCELYRPREDALRWHYQTFLEKTGN